MSKTDELSRSDYRALRNKLAGVLTPGNVEMSYAEAERLLDLGWIDIDFAQRRTGLKPMGDN